MADQNEFVSLTEATVRKSGQIILRDITFALRAGECWAVTGNVGSGKTTLLEAIAGKTPVPPGSVVRHQLLPFVSFKEESYQFSYSGYFYQQRYQATLNDDALTLREFLAIGDSHEADELLARLDLLPILERSFLKLSNGQTRKARIAKSLKQRPSGLLIDNPFVGLDPNARQDLAVWFNSLVEHGLTLMLVVEEDHIPACVTHVLKMEAGKICWAGPKADFRVTEVDRAMLPAPPKLQTPAPAIDFDEAFRLVNVTVRYGEQLILNKINWTVRAGERWALIGQNGAGKSVLLSLLYGDHPQAYANEIYIFGHRRGRPGESIWDVKRRIGFLSPELHLYFPQHLTARQVSLTGLTDTLNVPVRISPQHEADVQALLEYFGLLALSARMFGTLSAGEQRLILLVRALLKNSPLLLLDEPFQVLDATKAELARRLLDDLPEKTVLFITHDQNELPASVDRLYRLTPNS
ncbi:ATP-binding cassette domain-containing protein [Spirosoma sp. KUDC1026]|uniref:ATP-binding cassette domain-containing protein n=1 Tax=Spirosoma sp. KUDC1026 TaxID=2745947 RepID=UPI00159B8B99|nr:ATP-binding cassette domain-containing protein [Spirosoma sp. KUDC1026]QKZ11920.1 ATP-binding cassette domain-containing protein [Spirosoma sp. KUDC1026]